LRACGSGEIGALLRREGLYSSHLTTWRRERDAGTLEALGRRRGRKPRLTPEARREALLETKNARLERDLAQARLIVEVQKSLHAAGHSGGSVRARRERILSAASRPRRAWAQRVRSAPPLALSAPSREKLLEVLNGPRLADATPYTAYARLLDEGCTRLR